MALPCLALSVRAPWSWAIIYGGKDIENRSWRRSNPGLTFRGSVCIHASAGMTRDEYRDSIDWIAERVQKVHELPAARNLVRGAIIGVVDVVDVVRKSSSPWWMGPVGLVLANPRPIEPIPCKGALGFFRWQRGGVIASPAKWMLPRPGEDTKQDDFWSDSP